MTLHFPFDLYDYQVEFIGRILQQETTILRAGTGLGKGSISVAAAEIMLEDDLVDHVVVACETSKVSEWLYEISTYTDTEPVFYRGSPGARHRLLEPEPPPYLVGVYETLRADMAIKMATTKNKRCWSWADGPLTSALVGKRVLLLKDEGPAKMGATRTSWMYQANARFRDRLRSTGELRIVEISATPMDRDPEGYFNVGMLDAPHLTGNVGYFNENYVASRHPMSHKAVSFKNLSEESCEPGVTPLSALLGPVTLTKSKTDPDVVALFPDTAPTDYGVISLSDAEQELYADIVTKYTIGKTDREAYTLMRQFVGHPLSLTRSEGATAQTVVADVGLKRLTKVGTTKLDALVGRLKTLQRQGAQSVVFTFFGQSVLPLIAERLLDEGISVVTNHGGLSAEERADSQRLFRQGAAEVFLSSDAGARGINLETGEYVDEYDLARTASLQIQRINRISRLSSTHSTVFSHAWIVAKTIEDLTADVYFKRRGWHDAVMGEEGPTADTLRLMVTAERERLLGLTPHTAVA